MENIAKNGYSSCPVCGRVPDPATGFCSCLRPAADGAPSNPSPTLSVAQAESLFEIYLEARLLRARRALRRAKAALQREPRNRANLDRMRDAEIETKRLQAQLIEQANRITRGRTEHDREPGAFAREQSGPVSAQATEDFRAAQAVKAEKSYETGTGGNCPKCGQPTATQAAPCACGYRTERASRTRGAEPLLGDEGTAMRHDRTRATKRAE